MYAIGTTVLDRWIITRKLGNGSFGHVYEIQRKDFGETYRAALKVITVPRDETELRSTLDDGMSSSQAERYFYSVVEDVVREFALMAKLKGTANIVSYEDHQVVRHADGIGWDILIRMELLTPVIPYASEHPFSRRDIIRLGIDICRALELCQKYNIIHRDIKPDNIFVSDIGDFKLGDFGIARTIEKTMSGLSKKGTYNYMAPEVYRGEEYGFGVDIYSLGMVLYRLLNKNRMPFLPPAPQAITYRDQEKAMARRMNGERLSKPFYSEGRLSEIVLKACSPDPMNRYSSPAQMRQELEAIIYDQSEAELIYPYGDELSIPQNKYIADDLEDATQPDNREPADGDTLPADDGGSTVSDADNNFGMTMADDPTDFPLPDTDYVQPKPKQRNKKRKRKAIAFGVSIASVAAVVMTVFMFQRGKLEKIADYERLMEEGTQYYESNPRHAMELFLQAQILAPNEATPYVSYAYAMYLAQDYDDCISYIEDDLALGKSLDVEYQSQLSEILGAAYFEKGDYTEAASFFRLSTAGGDIKVAAMRDYAVSLGRIGDVEAANDILRRMFSAGAESDITSYVQAEVNYALKDYLAAESGFLDVLSTTSDSLLQRRCVRTLGELYRDCVNIESPPIEDPAMKSVQFLSSAISQYQMTYDSVLWEMLAMAYYDAKDEYIKESEKDSSATVELDVVRGYLRQSADAFQRVIDLGVTRDYLYNNLYNIYYELGDYEAAEQVLQNYESSFQNSYIPHALRCLMLISIENKKSQTDRDYRSALEEYETACEMLRSSDDTSLYQQIDGLVQQLRQEGWI